MVGKISSALDFQQAALSLRARRQQVLAGNIANADTPNYKARDFDFSTALKNAVAGRGGALTLATTNAGHQTSGAAALIAQLQYRTPGQASVDGNTVEMDTERAQFSENAIQYEAGIAFISHHLKTMMAAVQN